MNQATASNYSCYACWAVVIGKFLLFFLCIIITKFNWWRILWPHFWQRMLFSKKSQMDWYVYLLLIISNCVSSLSTMQSSSRIDGKMVNFCWKISLVVLFLVVCWMELLGEWAAMESDESKQSTFCWNTIDTPLLSKVLGDCYGYVMLEETI